MYFTKLRREGAYRPVRHYSWNLFIKRLSYSSGDAGKGVGVPAEGDGLPDGVLEVRGVQKSDDSLRNSPLAARIPIINRVPVFPSFPDFINASPILC